VNNSNVDSWANHPDEALLLEIIKSRDELAFRVLFDRYAEQVLASVVRAAFGSRVDPEVVLQDVFIKLWRSPDAFTTSASGGRLCGALRTTAIRMFISQVRRRPNQATGASEDAEDLDQLLAANGISTSASFRIDPSILEHAIGTLNEQDRHLVEDYGLGYTTPRELAARHGASAEAIRKRLRRAFDKMQRHLAKLGITSSALAVEIQILNAPPPALRGFPSARARRHIRLRIAIGIAVFLLFILSVIFCLSFNPKASSARVNPPSPIAPLADAVGFQVAAPAPEDRGQMIAATRTTATPRHLDGLEGFAFDYKDPISGQTQHLDFIEASQKEVEQILSVRPLDALPVPGGEDWEASAVWDADLRAFFRKHRNLTIEASAPGEWSNIVESVAAERPAIGRPQRYWNLEPNKVESVAAERPAMPTLYRPWSRWILAMWEWRRDGSVEAVPLRRDQAGNVEPVSASTEQRLVRAREALLGIRIRGEPPVARDSRPMTWGLLTSVTPPPLYNASFLTIEGNSNVGPLRLLYFRHRSSTREERGDPDVHVLLP
jgi:RNA polymerase sigma factor (sigma-70 family)